MTISLCMIVKDEADNLPQCLDSVRDFVDEIMVVDTGSEDDTIAIAQSYGAQVAEMAWTQDFATARNQSLARASSDWILVLDADEALTHDGQTLLRQLREQSALETIPLASIIAVNLLRHEQGTAQSPYSELTRIFRNRSDIQFERPYHESIDDSVIRLQQAEPAWQVVRWPVIAITHTGYGEAAIAQRDKFLRAEKIMAAYLAEHPKDAYICSKLGALYGSAGDWYKGQTLLERGLAAQPADPSTRYELHYHLGLAYRDQELLALAIDHYQQALAQDVPDILKVSAYVNLGSLYQASGNGQGALAAFSAAVAAAPELALAHFNLGIAKRASGDLAGAVHAYQRAIALNPAYAAAYQNLGVALFKLGKIPESIQAFQTAIAHYRQSDPAQAERLLQSISQLGIQP